MMAGRRGSNEEDKKRKKKLRGKQSGREMTRRVWKEHDGIR